jgi:hypothetical protein
LNKNINKRPIRKKERRKEEENRNWKRNHDETRTIWGKNKRRRDEGRKELK